MIFMMEKFVNPMPEDELKKIWKIAAQNWRLPYWDWANDSNVPELLTKPRVKIVDTVDPFGKNPLFKEVDNPMWRFRMPTGKPMGDDSHGDYKINYVDGLPVSSQWHPRSCQYSCL